MIKKMFAYVCLGAALTASAQNPVPPPEPASRLSAWSDIIAIEKTDVRFSSYYERMDYSTSRIPDYDWWTALLTVKLETRKVNGFNLVTELAAHMEIYDDNRDRYDNDIEDEAKESMSLLYLQYQTEALVVKMGRIDGKKGAHLDDNRHEGVLAKYQILENSGVFTNLSVMGGAISAYAEIDYDDAEEFYRVSRNNGGRGGDYVFFGEAKAKIAKMVDINPYVYTQRDYASVYGIDNKLTIGDSVKFGGLFNYNEVNSEVAGYNDAQNYDIGAFGEMKAGNSKVYIQAGTTKLDGSNSGNTMLDPAEQRNKPNWFRDYMTRSDQLVEYKEDARTYYIYTKVSSEVMGKKCWASVYLADIEYAPSADVEGVEFQIGYSVTEKLSLNLRHFIYDFNNDASADYGDDRQKTEVIMRYVF